MNDANRTAPRPEPPSARRGTGWGRRLAWWGGVAVGGLVVTTAGANALVKVAARRFLHGSPADVTVMGTLGGFPNPPAMGTRGGFPNPPAMGSPGQSPVAPDASPVAIVPGASVHRDGTPSPQLEARLAAALQLIQAGKVERVLVSGARNGAYDEAGPMRRWLLQRGVPPSAVLDDHAGFRTLDTMLRATRVYGVRRAVVCTQSFHLARAVFLARRAGIEAVGLAADARNPSRSAGDVVREWFANFMAVLDSYVLDRQAREPDSRTPGPSPASSAASPSPARLPQH